MGGAMKNEKLDHVMRTVDPAKRLFLKKLVLGAGFAIPIVASFSLRDMAHAGTTVITTTLTTLPCTSTVFTTQTITTGTTTTTTQFVTITATTTI
jgi:hypothetical protein